MSLPAATPRSPAALGGAAAPAPAPAPPLSVSCQWFYPMVGYVMLFYHRVEPRTGCRGCLRVRGFLHGRGSKARVVLSRAWCGTPGAACAEGLGALGGVYVWDSLAGTECGTC